MSEKHDLQSVIKIASNIIVNISQCTYTAHYVILIIRIFTEIELRHLDYKKRVLDKLIVSFLKLLILEVFTHINPCVLFAEVSKVWWQFHKISYYISCPMFTHTHLWLEKTIIFLAIKILASTFLTALWCNSVTTQFLHYDNSIIIIPCNFDKSFLLESSRSSVASFQFHSLSGSSNKEANLIKRAEMHFRLNPWLFFVLIAFLTILEERENLLKVKRNKTWSVELF